MERLLNPSIKVFALSVIFGLLASCEEVIEIDLNSAHPSLVAEGYMEEDSTCRFRLSYTSDYFSNEVSNPEEEATISIYDDEGNSEILSHLGRGIYAGSMLSGTARRTYRAEVEIRGESYKGSALLLPAPRISAIRFEEAPMGGPRRGDQSRYYMEVHLENQSGYRDGYLLKISQNGKAVGSGYQLADDRFESGNELVVYYSMMLTFEPGDSIDLEVYAIDEEAYTYYSQLNEGLVGQMAASSTPYNPASNLGENILGYFMARSRSDTSLVVP